MFGTFVLQYSIKCSNVRVFAKTSHSCLNIPLKQTLKNTNSKYTTIQPKIIQMTVTSKTVLH